MLDADARQKLGHNSLRAEVVTSLEQLTQVFALRALGFMEEAGMPFDHAYDGNDLQATHILVRDGTNPVGTMRIRWFKDFAKMERTTFRKSHRGLANVKVALDFAFAHIARKGYATAITNASPLYARLWRTHFGFKQVSKEPARYNGEEFFELVKYLDVPDDAITRDSSAKIKYRVEGMWDVPTKYEEG